MTNIVNKYSAVHVFEVKKKKPQIKITGIPSSIEIVGNELIEELGINNEWFTGDITFVRSYKVNSDNPYQCAILEIPLDLMKTCISKRRIQLGFNQCRIYEQTNLIQCKNCFRIGHRARFCRFVKRCRRCGDTDHEANVCTKDPKCMNCAEELQKVIKLATDHLVTEDRCYMKKSRLESLKTYLLSQWSYCLWKTKFVCSKWPPKNHKIQIIARRNKNIDNLRKFNVIAPGDLYFSI